MKRQASRHILDTVAVALVFAIPVASSALGGYNPFAGLGRNAVTLTASIAMPDAGIELYTEQMRSFIDEHSAPSDPQPEDYVETPQQPDTAQDPAEPQPLPGPQPTDIEQALQLIPEENRGTIEQVQYASRSSGDNYFFYGAGCIRNSTYYTNSEMLEAASGAVGFRIELNSSEPQVLIMHTHSTESYDRFDVGFYDTTYPTRLTEITENINAVGKTVTDTLNSLGINAIHATEYHDYPSYNNSYSRSAETVKKYLAMYPSIKVVLDIHRDGIQREDGTRVKPTVVIDGRKAAQIMIISGADDGTMGMPDFRENLKFAVRLQDVAERLFPGLTRPLYLAYRHYNQDLTTGSLLIEVGAESSTLEEACYTGELIARILADYANNP